MIEIKTQEKDIPDIVAIHIQAFPDFFLTTLGEAPTSWYAASEDEIP